MRNGETCIAPTWTPPELRQMVEVTEDFDPGWMPVAWAEVPYPTPSELERLGVTKLVADPPQDRRSEG